jgi:hypothetical protein
MIEKQKPQRIINHSTHSVSNRQSKRTGHNHPKVMPTTIITRHPDLMSRESKLNLNFNQSEASIGGHKKDFQDFADNQNHLKSSGDLISKALQAELVSYKAIALSPFCNVLKLSLFISENVTFCNGLKYSGFTSATQ